MDKVLIDEKTSKGVSLISVVITIIVVIIIVAIVFKVSSTAINEANFATFISNLEIVQEAIDNEAVRLRSETLVKGKVLTNGQIYNYIAKGGSSTADFEGRGKESIYTIIEDDSNLDIDLPTMKVNTLNNAMSKSVYAVTSSGVVFVWPPHEYLKYYINEEDTADLESIKTAGDYEVVIGEDNIMITVDSNINLVNPKKE